MDLRLNDSQRIDNLNFFVLGAPLQELPTVLPDVRDKILGGTGATVDGVWATLGWASDAMQGAWEGTLQLSKDGNNNSDPREPTGEEAKLILQCFPEIGSVGSVRERFINFDRVNFKKTFKPEQFVNPELNSPDAPYLRLTLMIPPDEGAVVFYQHSGSRRDQDALEYIQPESTQNHSTDRDRLTYLFPIVPNHFKKKKTIFGGKRDRRFEFVIKVLTFKRSGTNSDGILERVQNNLFDTFGKRNKFWVYDPVRNAFKVNQPDIRKKTLLLLHGTFSDTVGSFEDLLHNRWLQRLVTTGGKFQQVVGFDHRTVFHSLEENERIFLEMMNGQSFVHPVDIMTSSRGGLLLKQFITSQRVSDALKTQKAVTMACSNGVGLLRVFHAARFLSFMRYFLPVFMPWNAFVAALAQHSAKYLLRLPGLECQRPDKVDDLLGRSLIRPTTILPVVGDYKPGSGAHKFFKRLIERGIEALISLVYGREHDWIVQSRRQQITRPAELGRVGNIDPLTQKFNTKHSDYLKHAAVLNYIEKFLKQPG